jgi:hypothetical protein
VKKISGTGDRKVLDPADLLGRRFVNSYHSLAVGEEGISLITFPFASRNDRREAPSAVTSI